MGYIAWKISFVRDLYQFNRVGHWLAFIGFLCSYLVFGLMSAQLHTAKPSFATLAATCLPVSSRNIGANL